MQNIYCLRWYLKGEIYDNDTKNWINTSIKYEDFNAQ